MPWFPELALCKIGTIDHGCKSLHNRSEGLIEGLECMHTFNPSGFAQIYKDVLLGLWTSSLYLIRAVNSPFILSLKLKNIHTAFSGAIVLFTTGLLKELATARFRHCDEQTGHRGGSTTI